MSLSYSSHLAPDGLPFTLLTLSNQAGTTIILMDWGASWLSCQLPLCDHQRREVLLGCADPADYLRQRAFMGASVGRYANRIADARLSYQGEAFSLVANQPPHQLHGGPDNFSQRRWQIIEQSHQHALLQIDSPHGDQGFPGQLTAQVCYRLTEDNRIEIDYSATVTQPSPVSLTNHAYFNLDSEHRDARNHQLQITADHYLPVTAEGIPCAAPQSVEGTGFDFRQIKTIQRDFLQDPQQQQVAGYDHAYLLQPQCRHLAVPAATAVSSDGKVTLAVYTDQPALQFYSGNTLAGTPARSGGRYNNYSGFALESGFLPDSPNHPEWPQPDCWLQPGQRYRANTVYHFFCD